ncbi:MAG: polyprenyl synthetase family protein [Chloroflexi bacterium]|nr:polyprenyl synthetase family protein [Chloroflexota bacterium]
MTTTSQDICEDFEAALARRVFEAQLVEDLRRVEETLFQTVQSDIGLLTQAGQYVLRAGGKRLRPRVLLTAYRAMGGMDAADAIRLAAAVELLHTASLVHDDINDHSDLRRGQASVNRCWGDSLALLIGDFIFVRLLKLMVGLTGRPFDLLADCCTAVVEGETWQMLRSGDITEADYLAIVSRKTAALFAACAEMGGVLAALGMPEREGEVVALREYGQNLGMAFQIRDDALDLVGNPGELGKPVASDVAQGKISLATLYAVRHSSRAANLFWSQPPDTQELLAILREIGALDYATARAREYARRAQQALVRLRDSPARRELDRLAEYAVVRDR